MITEIDVTTLDRSGQVEYTQDEITTARLDLLAIAEKKRAEVDELTRELGSICAALEYALLGDDETAKIMVRCEACGTVYLKYRNPVDQHSASCPNGSCRMPVWLVPALEDRMSAADETAPHEDCSIGGSYWGEAFEAVGY